MRNYWTRHQGKNARRIEEVQDYYEEHPEAREADRQRRLEYFKKHPILYRKFLEEGRTPSEKRFSSKLGLVRSKEEARIANFLVKNRIKARYEPYILKLENKRCIPDFYLEKSGWLVEFHGGYPHSRKINIEKDKLYKKYKIPVIIITPSMLRNLSFLIRLKRTSSRWKKFIVN